MADQGGSAETVTISLLAIHNLKGSKGDNAQVNIKFEFGEKVLGESGKVECSTEGPTETEYSVPLPVASNDPLALDDFVCKPVVCTVVEILPKDKKQKEDKMSVLGQCMVDLTQMLTGETTCTMRLPIVPVAGNHTDSIHPADQHRPELEIKLSVKESILKGSQLDNSNILNMTMESLFSPPDAWNTAGTSVNYVAAAPLPQDTEKENFAVFTNGQLKPGTDKEAPNKRKKWAVPGAALGGSIYIGDKTIGSDAVDAENGDLKSLEDQEFRKVVEKEKSRITWNLERRCFLNESSTESLRERISKYRYLPVEIFRTALPAAAAKGKGKDDDSINFHGIAYVDASPLLFPGVKRIRGAYKVLAFYENDLLEKTSRRASISEDAARIATGILVRNSSPVSKPGGKKEESKSPQKAKAPAGGRASKGGGRASKGGGRASKGGKGGKHGKPGSAKASALKAGEAESEPPQPVNAEGMQYVDAKSYVMVEIELHKPLIRKKEPAELARSIAQVIPPRPMFPKKSNCSVKAVEDFHHQVGVVANLLLDEFKELFADKFCSYPTESVEEKRQKLLYHLNSSGKYLAFKEQLKYSVVKIVRDKYLKTSNFKDQNELQAFLSELYVYLVDEMHVGLGKVLCVEDQVPVPEPLTDSVQLKHFAREAEVNGNFELAMKFYKDRIVRDQSDPEHWLDYGTFYLYLNDLTKAEECFRECVAIDQRHLPGLLLNGVVSSLLERNGSAEMFFEAASTFEPQSILAWTVYGLYFIVIGNEVGAEMALAEADRLNYAVAAAEVAQRKAAAAEAAAAEAAVAEAAAAALKAEELAKQAAEEKEKEKTEATEKTEETHDVHVKGSSGKKEKKDKEDGKASKKTSRPSSSARASKGAGHKPAHGKKSAADSRKKSGGKHKSDKTVEEEPVPPPEPVPLPSETIYMQVIEFLLDVKAMPFTERALARHLVDPLGGPSAKYHLSLARLKLQKNLMDEAKVHVEDATKADYQCPDAWAIMGHVQYLTGDIEGAKGSYERALAYVGEPSELHSIHLRLGSIYLQEGKFRTARDTFLVACKRSPSCMSWLGVGIACYRMGELSDAEDALIEANILNNLDAEVWAYLCLVSLHGGRQIEAEQAYKYALKLSIQDDKLLAEIHELQQLVGFGNPQF